MNDVAEGLKGRDFTSIRAWTRPELARVLDLADELKARRARGAPTDVLPGRTVGLLFQKPSTRTRVSFEVGVAELGSTPVFLASSDLQLGRGESIRDTAYVCRATWARS